jgi:putative FmdB family regulatory protein
MPTYEYACEKCGRTFEAEQRISDPPLTACPNTLSIEERHNFFKNTCGTNGWTSQRGREPGFMHPDRCVCQGDDPTPHKHYDEKPHSCARCGECRRYKPALPERSMCGGAVRRLIAGGTGFVLNGKGWFKDGY